MSRERTERPPFSADAARPPRKRHGLRDEIELLQAIFDESPVMISCYDPDGRLLFANREWQRVLGWSMEEARGVDILREIYPDPAEHRRVLDMIREGRHGWRDVVTRTRDGRRIHTSWTRSILTDGTRLSLGKNISERVDAEEALRRSETRFRAIFDSALDAIFLIGDDGRYVDANPAACAMLGRSREDLIGLSIAVVTAPGFDFPKTFAEFLRSGSLHGEWGLSRPDGSTLAVEFTARTHILPGSHLAIVRDISERKRLEMALRASDAYLREGQRLSQTGSWAWKVGSGELFWSEETFRIFSLNPGESASHDVFLGRIIPEDAPRVKAEIARAVEGRIDFESSFRIRGPGDAVRHVHSLAHPSLDASGAVVEYVGVVTDVTRAHLAEERLKESTDELRALSERLRVIREEERTRIARDVHDEVGQALSVLQMNVAWMQRALLRPAGPGTNELSEMLASMSSLLETTLGTVQRIAAELRPGILDELGLEAAVEWYLREFEKRAGIEGHLVSDLGEPGLDRERSTAAFRILQEALTNVARHSGASRVEVSVRRDPGGFLLEIRDDGRGIPAERTVDARSLGLVGMRERARALGGMVSVRGSPGQGTRVSLRFPS